MADSDLFEMDEAEFKTCLKYIEISSEEDGASATSSIDSDENYLESSSPIPIDPERHTIIKIGPATSEVSSVLVASQKKKKKRKKKKKKAEVKGVELGTENPISSTSSTVKTQTKLSVEDKSSVQNEPSKSKVLAQKTKGQKSEKKTAELKIVDTKNVNKPTPVSTKTNIAVNTANSAKKDAKNAKDKKVVTQNVKKNDKNPQISKDVATKCKPQTKDETTCTNKQPAKNLPTKTNSSFLDRDLNITLSSLHFLLTQIPFNIEYLDLTMTDYFLFFPYLKVRPLSCLYALGNLIRRFAESHTKFGNVSKAKTWKLINNFYAHMTRRQQIHLPQLVSQAEAAVFANLDVLAMHLLETIAVDVYTKKGRPVPKCLQDSAPYMQSPDRFVQIFKAMFQDFRSHEELLEVADCVRERRFLYDGSYWDLNCESWLNFQELYLNCDVSALGSQNLEFWANFEKFQKINGHNLGSNFVGGLMEDDCYSDEASNSLTIDSQTCEDLEDTLKSDDHLKLFENNCLALRNRNAEDSNLNLKEAKSIFQNEEALTALDHPLQYVQQFCTDHSMILKITFFLMFKNVLWLFMYYCFDVVCLLFVFMYLCIYFVIKS